MKKNIKKIIILSTTTVAATMGISPILTSGLFNNGHSVESVSQQNTVSNSTRDVEKYLEQEGNFQEKSFVGDINSATLINNPYNAVDLSKLRENDPNKLKKAYRTLTNSYTSNFDKARESFLKEPILSWTDNNGNYFDTEREAEEYITKNGDFTESVGYYEIDDYANLDKNGKPIKRRINPLNLNDVNNLKKMAIENAFIPNSGFSFERMSIKDNKVYEDNAYQGLNLSEIKNLENKINKDITEIITKGIWLNPSLIPVPDKRFLTVYAPWHNGKPSNIWFDYTSHNPHSNRYIGMPYAQILEESKKIANYDAFSKAWEVWGPKTGWWNNPQTIFWNAKIKNIFGGQEYVFQLNDTWAKEVTRNYQTLLSDNTVNWLGKGNQINYYIDLYLNQDYLLDLLKNNATFKSNWDNHTQKIVDQVTSYFKNDLKDLLTPYEIEIYTESFVNFTKNILTTKLIPEQQHVVASVKSISQIDKAIDNLLRKKISSEISKVRINSLSFGERIPKLLSEKYQTQEKINDTSNIYVFKYNNSPLFKLDYKAFSDLYGKDEFGTNPSKAIENKIKTSLSTNRINALNSFSANMTNISNSYIDDVNSGIMSNTINKDAIDNYSGQGKSNNLSFAHKTIQSSTFDSKYQNAFINEERFKKYNITSSNLVKQLNLFDREEISYLNSEWGILESIYQYNKNLESLLKKEHTTELAKKQLESNYLKDANDIVVLFEKNKKFKNVRYAEYFNNGFKFNESLWDEKTTPLVHSYEYKDKWIEVNKLNKSSKVYTVKDYNNNIISSTPATGDNTNGLDKQNAINNAIQKINLEASKDFIYYVEKDNSETLLKNQVTRLNVLKVYNSYTSQYMYYGFAKLDDMKKYLIEYLQLGIMPDANNNNIIGDNISGSSQNATNATVAGITTAIIVLLAIEIAIVAIFVLNKRKK